MTRKLLLMLFIYVVLINTIKAQGQCDELIWSDEFDYAGFPNPEFWTHEIGGSGWGNNESQYYKANDEDNAWVENGTLIITAIKETYGGKEYTSARLITRGKFDFQYGKIEARIKLPYSQGIWPAFWMLGKNFQEVGWPECGEIDIMEFIGGTTNDNKIYGTAHWDNNGSHASYGGSYTLQSGIFADDFHTFTVEWTPQNIRWFIDGIQFHVMSITPAGLSEFHQPFFILLNLAVGGNWPGYPDETTVFPQTMEVDFVRVYTCGSVSTENFQPNENISIYPVPSEDIVNIQSKSTILGYSLSDLKGRKIFKYDNTNQNNVNLHIGKQPPGIYFLQVRTSDGSSHYMKLVKLDN